MVCPECRCQFPISAGLVDADAKRFGIAMAATEPALAAALVNYLSLHKPAKQSMRLAKATRIVTEINALVDNGEVRRNGTRRPTTPAMWVQAIESMLDSRQKLRLPLSGHGYLLEVLFSIADQADAEGERKRDEKLRNTPRRNSTPDSTGETQLQNKLAWLRQQREYKMITPEEYEQQAAEARSNHGAPDG